MEKMMYLSSFSVTEPDDGVYLYYPSWLNVWESHLYNKALKSTNTHGWGFKRFGTTKDIYAREMIRTPPYIKYIDAMEQVSDSALQQMASRERMSLMKSRTAFIYVDTWGESGVFEDNPTALHTSTIDTLPKNLVKKFSVKDFTCKMRGEKQSLIQAMRVAQDYLNWGLFDFVVICAAYRAVPILTFSDEDIPVKRAERSKEKAINVNLSIERVGCFIFSNRESKLKINCGNYVISSADQRQEAKSFETWSDIDLISYTGLRKNTISKILPNEKQLSDSDVISLNDVYGSSGCLSPALSWIYLDQNVTSSGKMRTVAPNNFGGYDYFDTCY
ncbi:MAG: ATP-binding protein [Enterobacteriaceae bacterium]|jgi:hypothetical protein|nr:ATP-binding protein [Enterobacteriaceae bacterium]